MKRILAGLRLVGTGLALWERLHEQEHQEDSTLVRQSVSLLCERVCEAVLQRAQADAASKAELVAAEEVDVALSAVLALQAGLAR